MLPPIAKIFLFIFIITSMLAIGLQVNGKNLVAIFQAKKLLIKALVANFIIIPLLGLVFIKTITMEPATEMAFILLAAAPGGLSAIQFISKVKGELVYAGGVVFLLSMLSVFISPAIIKLFFLQELHFTIPYFKVFWFLILFLLLPMLIGVLVHYLYKNLALKLAKPIAIIGTLTFFAFIATTLGTRQDALRLFNMAVLSLMLLFVVLTMVIGWFMGGPKKETRQILATSGSMRNAALCLMIATNSFPNMNYEIPLIAFSALMIFPNMIFTIFMLLWYKRKNAA